MENAFFCPLHAKHLRQELEFLSITDVNENIRIQLSSICALFGSEHTPKVKQTEQLAYIKKNFIPPRLYEVTEYFVGPRQGFMAAQPGDTIVAYGESTDRQFFVAYNKRNDSVGQILKSTLVRHQELKEAFELWEFPCQPIKITKAGNLDWNIGDRIVVSKWNDNGKRMRGIGYNLSTGLAGEFDAPMGLRHLDISS